MSLRRDRSVAIVAPSAHLFGGVQTWLDYLVPGLEEAGWRSDVLLVDGRHGDARAYLERHPFRSVRLVENPTGSAEGRLRALASAIDASGAALVLVANIVDAYPAVARLRARGAQTRVAMALHGLHACFYADMRRWSGVLDGVVATNRLAVAAAGAAGAIEATRVHYAAAGVPVSESGADPAPTARLELVFAGRFDHAEKRVLDLAPILAGLQQQGVDFRLRLAGAGPDEAALRASLSGFGARVEFLGLLDEASLRETLLVPDAVMLVLSPCETGPLVAWEAMSRGAVVASARYLGSGLEGALRDGETALTFDVGDCVAASAALLSLRDPALRSRLGGAGQALARERYSRARSIAAWSQALASVLDSPRLPPSPPTPTPAAGRLDRWFGVHLAEHLRRALGRRFLHAGPGGEWPHTHAPAEDPGFEAWLRQLDRGTAFGSIRQ